MDCDMPEYIPNSDAYESLIGPALAVPNMEGSPRVIQQFKSIALACGLAVDCYVAIEFEQISISISRLESSPVG
jgi:hypothetical protein